MGCILACLRFKDESKKKKKAHLKSSPVPSKTKEHLLSKDQFVSVFISEGSACEQVVDLNSQDDADECILDRDFRDEVKFLKSCGAILETPAELRKATEKLVAQHHNRAITSSHSLCLPATSFKKLVWDEQQEVSDFAQNSSAGVGECQARRHNDCASPSATVAEPVSLESGIESAALVVSTSQDDTHILQDGNDDSAFRLNPAIELESESTVLDVSPFQDDTHINNLVLEGVSGGNTKHDPGVEPRKVSVVLDVTPTQDDNQTQRPATKHSPYPTPLMLTDEMETPGTIYPLSYENLRRKNARVRTQYVYPVLNPVGNLTQWTGLREGSKQLSQPHWAERTPLASSLNNQNDKRSPNREEFDKENYGSSVKRMRSLTPLSDSRWKVTASPESHQLLVAGLSQCLKPLPGDKRSQTESNAMKYSGPERTPNADRPIFGVVAMHWNEDEDDPSKVTPKWWGGNGIPNTTTKYKEDQKVSWHATPFEERLDKALSDDKLIPRRKDISRKLVGLKDEGEESDTESS